MKGQKIGYVRVSAFDQNVDRQLDGIALDRVFTDRASGKDVGRPQLAALLSFIREGDTLVVHSMDRPAGNLDDVRKQVQRLTREGIRIGFGQERISFTGEDYQMATHSSQVMHACADFKQALISDRQR